MNYLGIQVGADLKKWSPDELMKQFGKSGILYYKMARAKMIELSTLTESVSLLGLKLPLSKT
jgi:nucleotidyltransferase/DNA polymerase involved in DNA repair